MDSKFNALEGVNILDLTQFVAGPTCTLQLALLGANVIKIERPGVGEQGRPVGGGQNIQCAILHANKKSITLNLKSDEGKELLRRLIQKSDVLVENYAPGTIERLGFGYEAVHEMNPRLIFCQIKGYAESSPYADYPAMDGPVQATGTLAAQTGLTGSPPVVANVPLADDPAGNYAATAILAALFQRERSGMGQHVRVNMQEVVISGARTSFYNQDVFPRRGSPMIFSGRQAPRGMFHTKPRNAEDDDNYVFMMVRDTPGQKMWKSLCQVMGRMDLFEDPRFLNGGLRLDNVVALTEEIEKWTSTLDKEEVMRRLCEVMIPAGATLTVPDIVSCDHMYDSGFLHRVNHPSLGPLTLVGSAFHMSDTYVDMTPSPDLGQHNDEIYLDFLGLSREEYAGFAEKHVI